MAILDLKDSDFINGVVLERWQEPSACMFAVDQLCRQFEDARVNIIQLGNYTKPRIPECPVNYTIESLNWIHGKQVIDRCRFFTSHYIGMAVINGVTIRIQPRIGSLYLLKYAANIYLSESEIEYRINSNSGNDWMLALLWRTFLNKALTEGMTPKEYKCVTENRRSFRGHMNVRKQIATNCVRQDRFYCDYKKLSFDNTINRTIRYTYALLKEKKHDAIIQEFDAYDKRLESFGVNNAEIDVHEIDRIRYNRLTAPYESVMRICMSIINNHNAELENGAKKSFSYFIDIAELWEMYLLKVLQRGLADEYTVYSPNTGKGVYLLENASREIRPDIIIEHNGRIVMIIDAKYKCYKRFGRTAGIDNVSREDLYQMNTYLYHYGNRCDKIIGIFTAPYHDDDINNNILSYTSHANHMIGLVNLPVDIGDEKGNIEKTKQSEQKYLSRIRDLLKLTISLKSQLFMGI